MYCSAFSYTGNPNQVPRNNPVLMGFVLWLVPSELPYERGKQHRIKPRQSKKTGGCTVARKSKKEVPWEYPTDHPTTLTDWELASHLEDAGINVHHDGDGSPVLPQS